MAHALALVAAENGNVAAAARALGIPRRTVSAWYRQDRRVPTSEESQELRRGMVQEERTLLAKEWREVTFNALARLKDKSANDELNEKSLVLLAGMGTDKLIALGGGNAQTHDVNVRVSLADLYLRALPRGGADSGAEDGARAAQHPISLPTAPRAVIDITAVSTPQS